MTTTVAMPHLARFPSFTRTGNAALAAALDDLPAYAEAETGKQRIAAALQDASSDLLTAAQARVALVAAIATSAGAGKPLPPDLPARAAKTAAAIATAREVVNVLQEAGNTLASRHDHLLGSAPATLLRHLDRQLRAALADARQLGLDDVTTADDAIDAGKVEGWQTYLQLTATAAEIRAAQRTVSAALAGGGHEYAQHYGGFAEVANYANVFPGWFDRQTRRPVSVVNGEPEYPAPPWGEDDDTATLWSYAVRDRDLELWVPDAQQLQAAYQSALVEAKQLDAARQAEDDGRRLTPDERARLTEHRRLQRDYQL